jgi:two-component system chemotaxis response regulator CheY
MADTKMRILIVDDHATMRKIVKNLLKQINFTNAEEADDGTTALEKLKKEDFDFVITDYNMPQMNGMALLKAIREDEKLKKLPVLMITAEASKENILHAAHLGVNDYVVKPFNAEILKSKIDKIFK